MQVLTSEECRLSGQVGLTEGSSRCKFAEGQDRWGINDLTLRKATDFFVWRYGRYGVSGNTTFEPRMKEVSSDEKPVAGSLHCSATLMKE
jgi:hypothetical protein